MKPGSNGRRPRGRPNRKQHGGPARPNNFDNGGQEGRVRGNAHQVYERYLAMARDAVSAGDRIASETYYQHAEHYFRVLNSSTDPQPNGQGRQDRHAGDTRQESGQQEGGRQEGGRRHDYRQDSRRPESARPDAPQASDAQGSGQPPMPPAPPAPVVSAMPEGNGQGAPASPAPTRQANQGGRNRRSSLARTAMARDGGEATGDAPQAQIKQQPEPQPQPEAQPGPRTDGGCEPTSL